MEEASLWRDGEVAMGYHIFLAGESNFATCVERGVYGGVETHGSAKSAQTNSEVISSFAGIRAGDFVFFYVKNRGIHGLWRTTTEPFYDATPIWSAPNQSYPFRVCFEPAVREFPVPVAMADVLDLRDKGKIWTFDLGAITRKNHYPITTSEGKELIRLLLRNNPVFAEPGVVRRPYLPPTREPLPVSLECDKRGRLRYEGCLNAWFVRAFAGGRLKELIGEYRDYLNYVPTSFNKVMDIFLTHVTTVDSVDILHKFTCMELKTDSIDANALAQIVKYENWLTRKLADGDSEMVQSILVGSDFDDKVLEYWRRRRTIEEKTVRLIKYEVDQYQNELILEEIDD
ncbi:MAG: EVE domain-containing protein [Dehalococcoidia bacterium]|nr:EVE domain-containing protein [Dehalococcoidia bacterium]